MAITVLSPYEAETVLGIPGKALISTTRLAHHAEPQTSRGRSGSFVLQKLFRHHLEAA